MVMDDTPMKMDDMMSMDDDPDAFCTGMAMSMYMDGFTSSLRHTWWAFASTTAHRREAPGCLNLFFPAWTLDGAGKFAAAAFGVLALGVAVEALSALRRSRAVALARAKHPERRVAEVGGPQDRSALPSVQDEHAHGRPAIQGVLRPR